VETVVVVVMMAMTMMIVMVESRASTLEFRDR
jgi:hypothetical protein